MKNFWVSWYSAGSFELNSPWWVSGERGDGAETICAAIKAEDVQAAKQVVVKAHDDPPTGIEWRFVTEHEAGWSPFSDRFPKAAWMTW
jgi:hypothetical protein